MVEVGKPAPNFTAPSNTGDDVELRQLSGRIVVLYFYPKDDTTGCTKEAIGFTEKIDAFDKAGAIVIGVSKDSIRKHVKFIEKYDLKVTLLADEDTTICQQYGVWMEKSMYGRKYMGIVRTTVLIDRSGVVQHIWPKVKVPGHVDAVLEFVNSM